MKAAWRYAAIDRDGGAISGTMDAADDNAVVRRLRRDGLMVLSVAPARGRRFGFLAGRLAAPAGGGEKLSRQEVTNIIRELGTMLGAGQDLDRALRFLVETAPQARVARVIGAIRDEVRDGSSLAAAFDRRPASFSRLAVGLVRAGEASGSLAPTLERLADLLERERTLAATVQSAMIYPALLTLAAIGAVTLLLTQVLPQFVPLFEQNGAALPASTRFLIAAGDAVSAHGLSALLGLLAALLVAKGALRDPGVRLVFDRLKLRLPVLGGLAREIMAARLARTLGSLVQSRVSLIPALGIVRTVLENEAGARAVDAATASASAGSGLSRALGDSLLFPPRLVHLLRLGEETAQLGAMALRAAAIHEERVRLMTERLVALLAPAITIAMGAVIAGIVSSLLLAMLGLNDLAQ